MAVLIELTEKTKGKVQRRYFLNSWVNVDKFKKTLAAMEISEEQRSQILAEGQYVRKDEMIVVKNYAEICFYNEIGLYLTTTLSRKDKLIIHPDLHCDCERHDTILKKIWRKIRNKYKLWWLNKILNEEE